MPRDVTMPSCSAGNEAEHDGTSVKSAWCNGLTECDDPLRKGKTSSTTNSGKLRERTQPKQSISSARYRSYSCQPVAVGRQSATAPTRRGTAQKDAFVSPGDPTTSGCGRRLGVCQPTPTVEVDPAYVWEEFVDHVRSVPVGEVVFEPRSTRKSPWRPGSDHFRSVHKEMATAVVVRQPRVDPGFAFRAASVCPVLRQLIDRPRHGRPGPPAVSPPDPVDPPPADRRSSPPRSRGWIILRRLIETERQLRRNDPLYLRWNILWSSTEADDSTAEIDETRRRLYRRYLDGQYAWEEDGLSEEGCRRLHQLRAASRRQWTTYGRVRTGTMRPATALTTRHADRLTAGLEPPEVGSIRLRSAPIRR